MKGVLIMAWRWPNGSSEVVDFVVNGELTKLTQQVVASLSLIGEEPSFYEGVIGDLQGEVLRLRNELKQANDSLDFWLERKPVGAMA